MRSCGRDGAHPVPDGPGVRSCACGVRTLVPAGHTTRLTGGALLTVDPGHVGTPVELLAVER